MNKITWTGLWALGEPKDFITKEKYPSNNMCIRIAHKKETKMSKHAKNVLSYLRVLCNKEKQTQNMILTTNVSCQILNLKVSNECMYFRGFRWFLDIKVSR